MAQDRDFGGNQMNILESTGGNAITQFESQLFIKVDRIKYFILSIPKRHPNCCKIESGGQREGPEYPGTKEDIEIRNYWGLAIGRFLYRRELQDAPASEEHIHTVAKLLLHSLPHPLGLDSSSHICNTLRTHQKAQIQQTVALKRRNIHTLRRDQTKTNILWPPLFICPTADFHLSFSNKGQRSNSPTVVPLILELILYPAFPWIPQKSVLTYTSLTPPEVCWCIFSHSLGVGNLLVAPSKHWAHLISHLPARSLQSPKASQKLSLAVLNIWKTTFFAL